MASAEALRIRLHGWFAGDSTHVPLSLFRIALATLILIRAADVLRPWWTFDHHAFTSSPEFWPAAEPLLEPRLHSPLWPMPALPDVLTSALVHLRTVLALLLLLGVRTRATALLLALVGYGLMASDRYRYFHHMHLLWISCLWLAATQAPTCWSVERLFARPSAAASPRWSLQLLRAQCLIVYAAAALAKLEPAWLSGRIIDMLVRAHAVGGPLWRAGYALLGSRGVAYAALLTELALALFLSVPRLRWLGVLLGVTFHCALSASMMVSTFSAQMIVYLMLFLPWREGVRGT